VTIPAGVTVLPVQTLTLDAAGKPTVGTASATCSGFDDCITYMDNTREQHETAAQQTEEGRTKFVQQHNTTVKTTFDAVANQFAQIGQLMTNAVNSVNDDLTKMGIKATIKTKTIDSEPLEEDEKTGLIKVPKSMKAAFASRTNYTEVDMDKINEVTDAYNSLAGDLNKKAAEAQKMLRKCKVTKDQYDALARLMPADCGDTNSICGGRRDRTLGAMGMIEPILKRSKVVVEENERSSRGSNSEYSQCKSEFMSDAQVVLHGDIVSAAGGRKNLEKIIDPDKPLVTIRDENAYAEARDMAQAKNRRDARKRARDECSSTLFQELDREASEGREGLRQQNQNIVSALRDVADECGKIDPPSTSDDVQPKLQEDEGVTYACEEFKRAAQSATPPTGEDATDAANYGGQNSRMPSINPMSFPSPLNVTPVK
jgi:hypothetical protein